MEILTFYDDVLQEQKKSRFRLKTVFRFLSRAGSFVVKRLEFFERIPRSARIAAFSAGAGMTALLFTAAAVNTLYVHPVRVSLAEAMDADTEQINAAVKKFVSPADSDAFDASGNVSSMTAAAQAYTQPVTFRTYTVRKNDNIGAITRAAGLQNISTLIGVNNISDVRRLQAGQKLRIPSIDGLLHTVGKNESLNSISARYGVTLEKLLDVNDLSSAVIQPNDVLFIPEARLSSFDLKKALGELFISPLAVSWRLTSAYGYRNDPFTDVRSFHTGLDMAAPHGTPVRSTMDGRVGGTGFNRTYGNFIIIIHSNGYQSLYAHLSAVYVKEGQQIRQNSTIGAVGNTGYSTGPHLHFTLYHNGKTVNPAAFIR